MPKQNDIKFPLDSFLERLAVEEIFVSLPQRLQLLTVIQRFGQTYIDQPHLLKYKIAPIIAKNASQQRRVQLLFDEYLAEAQAYQVPALAAKKQWWQKLERWQLGLLTLAFLLIPLGLFWSQLFPAAQPAPLEARFNIPKEVTLGQSLPIVNTSLHVDTAHVAFKWELFDVDRGEREFDTTLFKTFEWELPIEALGESPDKFLQLTATDTLRKQTSKYKKFFQVNCADPPAKPAIVAPLQALVGDPIRFGMTPDSVVGMTYHWDFEGDTDTTDVIGTRVVHTFSKPGVYKVKLEIHQSLAQGYCQVDTSHTITITNKINEKAYLADLPLVLDEEQGTNSELNFFWMSWLLLGLIISYALYHFWRWLNQSPPEKTEEEKKQVLDERFAHADKGPYTIPFENQGSAIRVEESLFRLADKLRQRQEGSRTILDVPASVRQTIDQGGFPILLQKRTTLPPEYLFLIDEQAEQSHQAALYEYLVYFLKDKDVFINSFHYNTSFNRFWNDDYPDGISLERLQQLFTQHRLVILGDGYDLMDQTGDQLKVKASYQEAFEAWVGRLLLTPIPPSSWTFKEATIYQLFPVFDSDASGFAAALKHLDILVEEADDPGPRPSFIEWQEAQSHPPEHPDVNHRRWRRAETYRDYLKDYPEVYRWLCALAVYPNPHWQLTLGIGRAIGAPVNFDNLLLLSRIPWLQGQAFHPKLRQELLDQLDPETDRLAREAVQEALTEIAPKVAGSHVNLAVQTNLAIQSFLLDPADPEHSALIAQLKQHKLLGKRQMLELDGGIRRKTNGSVADLTSYLQGEEVAKGISHADADLAFNQHFFRAFGAAIVFLMLGMIMLLLNGSDTLCEWVKGTPPPSQEVITKPPSAYAYFFKEETIQDSAIIYNNKAVYTSQRIQEADKDSVLTLRNLSLAHLLKAMQLRDNYSLAMANHSKALFNLGVTTFNDYLELQQDRPQLEEAQAYFDQAAEGSTDSLGLIQHAQGLCYWYLDEKEDARRIYNSLKNDNFFDDYTLQPNLKSFFEAPLTPAPTGEGCAPVVAFRIADEAFCRGDEITLINDSKAGQDFAYFTLDWGDGQQDSLGAFTEARHRYTTGRNWTVRLTGYINCDSIGMINKSTARRISNKGCPDINYETILEDGWVKPKDLLGKAYYLAIEDIAFIWPLNLANDGSSAKVLINQSKVEADTSSTLFAGQMNLNQSEVIVVNNTYYRVTLQRIANAGTVPTKAAYFKVEKEMAKTGTQKTFFSIQLAPNYGRNISEAISSRRKELSALGRIYQDESRGSIRTYLGRFTNRREVERVLPLVRRIFKEATIIELDGDPDEIAVPLYSNPYLEPEMVFVEGGIFTMGCVESRDGDCKEDELPTREVNLSDFWIGKYEVTNEEFVLFLQEKGNQEEGGVTWYVPSRGKIMEGKEGLEVSNGYEKHPIAGVSWYAARAYASWLSEKTGQTYRLPTEAEWEFAARGGTRSQSYRFAGSNKIEEVAWSQENSGYSTHVVGDLKANELGIHDMSGNVWEWCSDWYGAYEREKGIINNPKGPNQENYRVLRGCSWRDFDDFVRVSYRNYDVPDVRDGYNGFRLSRAR